MKQFYIKNFRKKEAIKVYLIGPDKRIGVHYVVPDGAMIHVAGKTFQIVEDKMFYNNGFPSFICSHKSAEPVNPNDINNISMSPDDYNTAISAQVAKEIFRVTGDKIDMQMISVILSAICLIGLVFLYITFKDYFTFIINHLPNIETTTQITSTGGY